MRTWRSRRGAMLTLSIVLLISLVAIAVQGPLTARAALSVTTSWTGNSFSGASKWVQNFVWNIGVSGDGTVYTISNWDEGGHTAGTYKDGDNTGNCAGVGGDAIAINSSYVYFAKDNSMVRYNLDCSGTSLSFNVGHSPVAAAANSSQLAVTDATDNAVKLFDINSGSLLRSWSVNQPGTVSLTSNGDVWVVSNVTRTSDDRRAWVANTSNPPQILHFANNGTHLSGDITGPASIWIPTALAIDNQGRLLVGDNGPNRQVYFYSNLSGTPTLAKTFGTLGGIGAGAPGQVTPTKFFGITGVGTDSSGNLYVSTSEHGVVIRKFDTNGNQVWQVLGLNFVDVANADPASDGLDLYAKQEHYTMDYTKPAGQEWNWTGYSLDSVKYPQDPRIYLAAHDHHVTSPFLIRKNGHLYMYLTGMYSGHLTIYRFDGEIAKPVGAFFKGHWDDAWPPNQPAKGEWYWRDNDGQGDFDADEYLQPGTGNDAPNGWTWFVDNNGDVWQGGEDNTIRRFPLQGFDSQNNPIYTYSSVVSYTV